MILQSDPTQQSENCQTSTKERTAASYQVITTSANPAPIILCIDKSGSMFGDVATDPNSGSTIAKYEAVKQCIEFLANDLCLKSRARRSGKEVFRELFHVFGFTFSDDVKNLFNNKEYVTPEELASYNINIQPSGSTSMYKAAEEIYNKLKKLLASGKYDNSFPPVVFFLSDGVYTDSDPTPVFEKIKQLKVKDGNVLCATVYFSPDVATTGLHDKEDPSWSEAAKVMFRCATELSIVPRCFENYFKEYPLPGGEKITAGQRLFFTISNLEALKALIGVVGSSAT